jgi:predicted dehydrogenase
MTRPALRVLVIGTGSIGRRHIANLRTIIPDCGFIFLRDRARRDDLSDALNATVVDSLAQALAIGIDLAVLASPSDQHAATLLPLLAAKVPTFVEKPVVTGAADADKIAWLSDTAPTQVGCVLRFLPSLQLLKEWIESGRLGRIVRAGFEVGQYLPDWRPGQNYRTSYSADPDRGGGVVLDLVHEIDLACWFLGNDLTLAGAWGAQLSHLDIRSEDTATLILLAAGGAQASVQLDYVSRTPVRRLTIVGDEGTATWTLGRRELVLTNATGIVECVTNGFDVAPAYVAAMRELVEAVRSGAPTSLPLVAGLPATRLAIAANALIRSSIPAMTTPDA